MRNIHLKRKMKSSLTWLCIFSLVVGLFAQAGPIGKVTAADTKSTADPSVREWYVYGDAPADTGLVVTDTTGSNTITSGDMDDAGVKLPDGLTESNFKLQVKVTVEGDSTAITTLNNAPDLQFELANELRDCGELSWPYRNFVSGTQVLSFEFKDAAHTNHTPVNGSVVADNKTPFDWQETINWFRFYQTASTTGLKITVNEIKIVYGEHGLQFGDTDTYLKLDSAMDSTPKAVEATVNMPTSISEKSWTLRPGTSTTTSSGHTLGTGVTAAGEAPGAGMPYSVLDASGGAISGFGTLNNGFGIDATGYELSDLAVAFWVWSSEAGTLGTGDQFRIGSGEYLGSNALIYYYNQISVAAGWNYIELPLDKWGKDIIGNFTVSNINCFGFTAYNLAAGQKRYFGEFKLVALNTKTDDGLRWTLRSGSTTTTSSGHAMTTGMTAAGDAPGAGVTYSILDASSSAISGFSTNDSVSIDISAYEKDELAVAFWVYSNSAGTFGGGDNFRISSGSHLGEQFLHHYYNNIQVVEGWNYIVLPLSEWSDSYNFDWKTITRFGFTGFSLPAGQKRYFTDFEIVVLEPETEWQLCSATGMQNVSHTITTGTTTAADAPGAGMNYFTVDASSSAISGFNTRNSNQGINTGDYTIDEVSLAFWVWSNSAGTLGTGDQFRIGSGEYLSGNALIYYYNNIPVEEGWNYVELPLSTWGIDIKGDFTVSNINSFGFTGYNLAQGQIRKFSDFKLVVSGKGANWTLCDTSTTYNNNYGLKYTASSVTGEEKEPEVGTNYAKIEVPAYDASVAESGKFGFELPSMPSFDVSANPSEYAVGFWFYSSTGMIPSGQFELNSSSGANDAAELHWYPQNWGIQKGWNYVTVNLGAYASDSTPSGVDFSNINYLRWYSDNGAQVTQDTVFAISDIELIKADNGEVVKTLCKAENQPLWYGLSKNVQTVKEGPSAGTTYMETTVPGYDGSQPVYKSCFGFFTTFNSINASAYEASNLTVSMWVYTANGKLPGGQIEINSSGGANDNAELRWYPSNFNSQLQIGWNKLELNLGSPHGSAGTVDLSNINYIRWYTDENESIVLQADTTFRIGEIKLYADTVDEGDILVTQNAKVTSDNYMIFSNANRAKEANPFAVFVTGDGYPAVLCGTTQFTLTKNICTGTDVTLKVVRTNAGAIKFYINGELAGTSKTVADSLGAPSKAYSIGADGKGNQVFVGTIKDVKAYSNVAATKCIGNWPLVGDIKYVTEVMPDISGKGNDAHFAGSRAKEWYTVDAANADAGEWSLVYIPEVCQRFYTNQHSIYHKMAKWIAEDAKETKHDNIKYVVGDKTADPGQLDAVNVGFEFFDTAVASSNLNNVTGGNHTYYRFQAGDGVKWMIMSLDVYVGEAAYTWAKEIADEYPSDNIIVATDVYTSAIYDTLGSRVKAIISGGIAEGDAIADGVPAMILPAHNDTEKAYFGGEQEIGLLYVLRFTGNGTLVTPRAYAPVYGKYFDDSVTRNIGSIAITPEKELESLATPVASATGGVAPSDVPAGYKFAGWYQQYEEALVGKTYSVWDGRESAQTFGISNTRLGINAGAYAEEDLAIQFWVYANADGKLAAAGDHQLRVSSYEDGVSSKFRYWSLQNMDVKKGWNLISLPLSSRAEDFGFDKSSFQSIGFTSFAVSKGNYRYITDMELVVLSNPSVRWMLRSANDVNTTTGQTLTTGVADGFALAVPNGTTKSNVYAKYVDGDVLGVKAQVLGGTNDKSNYTNIRFLTSVDSLNYKVMGFDITFTNPYTGQTRKRDYACNKYVYENIVAMDAQGTGVAYAADEIFSSNSGYFKAYTITNTPNWAFSEAFTVEPYWITLDGTKVYGDPVDKSVWMGYQTEHLYLPQIINTTYETEDVVIATIVPTVEKYGYNIDPTGQVDCTAELQRALNDCHNMGGGTVYLPAGTYKISGGIDMPSYVTLRGDYNDPDKKEGSITNYGTVFNVYPTTEYDVERNGTLASDALDTANRIKNEYYDYTYNNNGSKTYDPKGTFIMAGSSGIVGITVYYPEQTKTSLTTDNVKKYPYTFYVPNQSANTMLMTIKDVTVINGYRGIGTSYTKQHECLLIDNFKGTFLDCGMALYNASDAGRVTGVSINADYWKNYDGTNASTYVLANAVGMEIGDLEWQQFSNCSVKGYNIGINIVGGYRVNFAGSMIDMNITECNTGLTIAEENDDVYYIGKCDIDDNGDKIDDKLSYPLLSGLDPRWGMVIARSAVQGTTNSLVNNTQPVWNSEWEWLQTKINQTSALLRLTDVATNNNNVTKKYHKPDVLSSATNNIQSSAADLSAYDAKYDESYNVSAAQRKNLWVVDLEAYDGNTTCVAGKIQEAIDKVIERNPDGGIVYVPGGTYRLENPITIPAGIELRGASSVANREQSNNCEGTLFMCYYGDDGSVDTEDGTALVTVAGANAGVNGLRFLYPENIITYDEDLNSTYVIRITDASEAHVVNCYIASSLNGIDVESSDNFYIEGVYACCYQYTLNVESSKGIIRGCLSNPNMLARTNAEGLTDNWPTEAKYDNTTAIINEIRNSLMQDMTFVSIYGKESDVLVQDITAYAVNTLCYIEESTVVAINANSDALWNGEEASGNCGYQFYVYGGSLTAINALRASIDENGNTKKAQLYFLDNDGQLRIYNSINSKADQSASAYEENIAN